MNKIPPSFILAGAIVFFLFVLAVVWGVPYFFQPPQIQNGNANATLGSQTVLARVTDIVDEGQINLNGRNQLYQVMSVDVLEGDYTGMSFQIDYGKRQLRNDNFRFVPGDEVYVMVDKTPNNQLVCILCRIMSDRNR